jgi:hypothetical protein
MRSVTCLVWSGLFLLGAAIPAFCQVIVPPNIPGAAVPANLATGSFSQSVFSTGPYDFSLAILKNGQLKYCASGTVCTSGPFSTVKFDVPLGSFDLHAGDTLIFIFTVRHRGTEGNTVSANISIIPVVGATPTQTTRAKARREEILNG